MYIAIQVKISADQVEGSIIDASRLRRDTMLFIQYIEPIAGIATRGTSAQLKAFPMSSPRGDEPILA